MSPTIAIVRPRQILEFVVQREEIEQGLRRMGVRAVSRVDRMTVERGRHLGGQSGFEMAHDDHGDAHGFQREDRVLERLALGGQAQIAGREIDDVRSHPHQREIE